MISNRTVHAFALAILGVCAAVCLIVGACAARAGGPALTGVWALDMPTISDAQGKQTTAAGALANLAAAHAAGITGLQADAFCDPDALAALLTEADNASAVSVAYELDLSFDYRVHPTGPARMIADAKAALAAYVALAAHHKSAARTPDGRLIVWVYGSRQLTSAQWSQAVAGSTADCFFVGDTSGPGPWQATWCFLAGSTPNVVTLEPQYTRPSMPKLYLAPDGGARYRAQWTAAIAANAAGIEITSWNDSGDGTLIDTAPLLAVTKLEAAVWAKRAGR